MTGLIIGKFCPPHKGHKLLIDTGTAETDALTVLVCASAADPLPIDLRLEWLREMHPTVDFQVIFPDTFDRSDANAWVAASLERISGKPDLVFSSEEYGILYAEILGAGHRMIDKERVLISCTASEILQDPSRNLHYLEEPVRRYFDAGIGN